MTNDDRPFELPSAGGGGQLAIAAAINQTLRAAASWVLVGEARHPAGPGQTEVGE